MYRKKETIWEKEDERYKAWLEVKGYSQRNIIDYDKIFSPVVSHTSTGLSWQ